MKVLIKILIIIVLGIGAIRAVVNFIGKIITSSNDSSYSWGYSIGTLIAAAFFTFVIVKLIQSIRNGY